MESNPNYLKEAIFFPLKKVPEKRPEQRQPAKDWGGEGGGWRGHVPVAQQVKDLVLLQLWRRLGPWSRNFHLLQVQKKKKKKGRRASADLEAIGHLTLCSHVPTLPPAPE